MTEKDAKIKEETRKPEILAERVFLEDDLVPNAAEAFFADVLPLDTAIKTANVVLDTNVLLLPYGAGSSSFQKIIEVFSRPCKTPPTRMNTSFLYKSCTPIPSRNVNGRDTF